MKEARAALAAAFVLQVLIALPAGAADTAVTIPVTTLDDYAYAIGSVGGAGTYLYSVKLPVLQQSGPFSSAGSMSYSGRAVVAKNIWILHTVSWNWKVVAPHYAIEPAGVRFVASLEVSDGIAKSLQPISIPVSVGFNAAASQMEMKLATAPVPVFWTVLGQTVSLGTIDISPYYSAAFYVGSQAVNVSGRTVTGSVSGVSVQLLNGAIRITNDVQF